MNLRDLTEHEFVLACRTLVCGLENHMSIDIDRAETTAWGGLIIYVQPLDLERQEVDIQQAESVVRDVCRWMSLRIKPEQVEFIEVTRKGGN